MNDTSPALDPHLQALIMGASTINNILGLPLNVYVVWLILTGARETLALDFVSLNLAMSEILFAVSYIGFMVYLQSGFLFGFEAFMFSRGFLFSARPLLLCCICVEYYVGVVHPMLFLQFKPLRYKVACCCVIWLITLGSCIFSWYTYSNTLYMYGFFIQNLFLFSAMLLCCLSVLRVLRRPGPGEKDPKKKKGNKMKRRAFKIILLIAISLAINFLLFMVVIPLQSCLTSLEFAKALTVCMCLALMTGFIQPILYLHRAKKLPCYRKI